MKKHEKYKLCFIDKDGKKISDIVLNLTPQNILIIQVPFSSKEQKKIHQIYTNFMRVLNEECGACIIPDDVKINILKITNENIASIGGENRNGES